MSAPAARPDAPAVEPNRTSDTTQPELAPPIRPSPVGPHLPSPDPVRARRATLASPIPALLAAAMIEILDEGEGTPQPVDLRADATSRFDATAHPELMANDDEADYVVEVDGKSRR
jgi:hypothetical protein